MKYTIDKNSKSPAYLQLYYQIRKDIIENVYPYKSKLPSKRLIADELGISSITVARAYDFLCDEGFVQAKQRSGYYVLYKESDGFVLPSASENINIPNNSTRLDSISAAKDKFLLLNMDRIKTKGGNTQVFPQAPNEDALLSKAFEHVSTAENPASDGLSEQASDSTMFSRDILKKTMRKIINEKEDQLFIKSPSKGFEGLRVAISDYLLRSRGLRAEPEDIIIGSGAEAIYEMMMKLLGKDRVYAIELPSYKKIRSIYSVSNVKYEQLPLCKDGIVSDSLRRTNASVLHITPYCSFPSGVSASASKRSEYLAWASINDRYIIEDDFASEFTLLRKPEETLYSNSEKENVIYMNSFSKTISGSFRVGYAVIPKKLRADFGEKFGSFDCTVPSFEQLLLTELIESGNFERHINKVRRIRRKSQNAQP